MKIMPNRMDRGFELYQQDFENKAIEVLRSGWYILGKEVSAFEEEFARYTGAKYCVGLASGLQTHQYLQHSYSLFYKHQELPVLSKAIHILQLLWV